MDILLTLEIGDDFSSLDDDSSPVKDATHPTAGEIEPACDSSTFQMEVAIYTGTFKMESTKETPSPKRKIAPYCYFFEVETFPHYPAGKIYIAVYDSVFEIPNALSDFFLEFSRSYQSLQRGTPFVEKKRSAFILLVIFLKGKNNGKLDLLWLKLLKISEKCGMNSMI